MTDRQDDPLGRVLSILRSSDGQREWFTVVGGVGVLLFVLVGVFGPWLAPHSGERLVGPPFQPPSAEHLLGTDDVGHDIFSLLLVGARVSLFVGIVAGTAAVAVGTVVGVVAGVVGGRVETALMRVVDVVLTIPFLPLVIVVAAVLGPGLWTTVGVLSAVMWARPARELRSEVLSVREREYIEASRAMGASVVDISIRYVLPAVLLIVIAQYARAVSMAILLEAALSFLGLGDPTRHTWGTILFWAQQRSAFLTEAWKWWVIPPGLAITFSVLSFIFVTLGLERRSGVDRRSIATDVPGADIEVLPRNTSAATDEKTRSNLSADGGAGTDPTAVLEVADLTVAYGDPGTVAVDDVDAELYGDEILGVVGESGSGKSSFALALLDLLRSPARVADGRVTLRADREFDGPVEMADVRGDVISFVPQEAMNALDPRARLLDQVAGTVRLHRDCDRGTAERRARETLASVGLPPESHDRFPFELSGGMRQRGVLATALVNDPSVLVVDEPTTGLDIVTTVRILELLEDVQTRRNLSVVVISHDLAAVTRVADRVAVMHHGRFVEVEETERLLADPDHLYSRELLAARTTIPDPEPRPMAPPTDGDGDDPHLVYDGVTKTFDGERVLDGVDLAVGRGRSVALLGESGAGKSTLGRMALGLNRPDEGTVRLDGEAVGVWRSRDRQSLGRAAHCVFQDPYSSLAPNRPVGRLVREPLDIHEVGDDADRGRRVREALADVGLDPGEYAKRYASELSGGERQRVAFARALVHDPSLLVADEPISMLDAPLQRDLLETMYDLVRERDITLLHITHDVAQAATFADDIAVLHDGRILERGDAQSILRSAEHEQTRTLVEATVALAGGDAPPSELDLDGTAVSDRAGEPE